ncbi:hypothetical protein HDV04_005947 [Boothiomyces sp. JEL0838]|nr:hypothetical protein HDV04_005947 [Boothiomyces sp. JEL0838]
MDFDQISAIVSSGLLGIYAAYFIYNLWKNPDKTTGGWMFYVRKAWVKETSEKNGGDMLTVQTLRNWIFVTVFLATAAVTLGFNAVVLVLNIEQLRVKKFNPVYDTIVFSNYTPVKAIMVITFNFSAFFCFLQAIRYLLHVGFAMGVTIRDEIDFDQELDDFAESTQHISEMLNNGSVFYTTGIRLLYFAIPYFFWFLSPIAMLISTILMITLITIGDLSPGLGNLKQY